MRRRFNTRVGKIPWRRKWQPTPVFLPASPWGRKESDTGRHSPPLTLVHTPILSFLLLAWILYAWIIRLLHSPLSGWFSSMNDCHTKSMKGSVHYTLRWWSPHPVTQVVVQGLFLELFLHLSIAKAFQLFSFCCLLHSTITVTNNMKNSSPWYNSWIWKNLIKKGNHTHSLSTTTSALFWNFGNFSLHFCA